MYTKACVMYVCVYTGVDTVVGAKKCVHLFACKGVVCHGKAQVLSCLSDVTATLNSFPPQKAKFCDRW